MKWLAPLLLLGLPVAAWADTSFFQAVGVLIQAFGGPYAWIGTAILVASSVYGSVDARRKARAAQARAREQYNAGLQDRAVTVLQSEPALDVVYGRAIKGGKVVAIFTSDKAGVREDGTAFTKPDALKHLVIQYAAHEVQAINEVYIEGVPVGTLDGSGYPTGGAFYSARTDSRHVTFSTATVNVGETVSAVLGAYSTSTVNGDPVYTSQTVTVTPPSTLNNGSGLLVDCDYTVVSTMQSVRIFKHLGTPGEAADAYLQGVVPSQWTAADTLEGHAYLVVTLDLEDQRFQGGPPNITADITGKALYDPRTGTTAYSTNPALAVRDWLTSYYGFDVDAQDVDDASVIVAANACDATISLTVGGSTTTGPTYTCNGVATSADGRERVLEDLVECMAGYAVYGAQWRVLAGVWTAPVMDLTDADLDGQIEVVQAGAGLDELFNGCRGSFIPASNATPSEINPPYQNATFLAADGKELWTDLELPFTDNGARARNLARIFTERNRSGQVIRYPAKLRAFTLQVGDRVTVTSAEYGLAAKPYRVTDWQFGIQAPVLLTLQEDVAGTYDLADAANADPSPNTGLADPGLVSALSSVTATSGTGTLYRQADGTIAPRVLVSWAAVTDAYVADGTGRIEVLWRGPGSLTFTQVNATGDATGAYITGVREGDRLTIEVRARNSLQKVGPSTFLAHTVLGKTAAPSSVAGLAATGIPGGVQVTWTPNTDADYLETEVRYGASWAAGTVIFRGAAAGFVWPWPAAASYTVRVKHRDTSKNESSEATASITVGNSSLIDSGQVAPNAATEIVEDSYDFAGATYTSTQVVRSWTRTPPVDCTIELTAEITAQGVYSDIGNYVYWRVTPDGGSTITLAGRGFDNASTRGQLICVAKFAATGGVQLTYDIRVTRPASGTITLFVSYVRTTEIKR